MPELVHRGIRNEGGVARLGHPLVTKLGVVDVREPVDEGLQPQTVGIFAVPVLHLASQQRPDGRPEHWPRLSELVSALHRHLLAPIVWFSSAPGASARRLGGWRGCRRRTARTARPRPWR